MRERERERERFIQDEGRLVLLSCKRARLVYGPLRLCWARVLPPPARPPLAPARHRCRAVAGVTMVAVQSH